MKKTLQCISILIIIVCMLCACMKSKDEIFSLVSNNKELLMKAVEEGSGFEPGKEYTKLGIRYIWNRYQEYCEFDCGRDFSGFVGFYYSADDMPKGWEGDYMELKSDGVGWSWRSDKGDHYYTERIKENWFYYYIYL